MYSRLYDLSLEGKSYLSVLYNLGLIIIVSTALGILMSRITDLLRKDDTGISSTDKAEGPEK